MACQDIVGIVLGLFISFRRKFAVCYLKGPVLFANCNSVISWFDKIAVFCNTTDGEVNLRFKVILLFKVSYLGLDASICNIMLIILR
jgi:hypothetical protein